MGLLAGCGQQRSRDLQVFYYNEARGVATLDPAMAKSQSVMWPIHQIFNTLVVLDDHLNVQPSLATHWQISADNLTYTFYLRSDVYFQDDPAFKAGRGRKMTAFDVAFSLNRIINPATASTGAWIFNDRLAPGGCKALNDSVFELKLVRPFHPILNILTMDYCSVVAPEAVSSYGKDFGRHPVGTGPFGFKYWDEGQSLVLTKNRHYWEKDSLGRALPYLDAVSISFYSNKATEFLKFRQHNLSFINDIDPAFKDEVISKAGKLREKWKGIIHMEKHPYLNVEYLGILMDPKNPLVQGSPLKDKRIRQAIAYAIPKKQLMMYLRNSIGLPATGGFVPDGMPSRNAQLVKGFSFNMDKSLALLKQAGYPGGKGLPAIKLSTAPENADIASFIARQADNVGIHIDVEVSQKSMILQQTAKSEAVFFIGTWIADYPDPENYMAFFNSKNPAPPNYTRFNNKEFDRLYQAALLENVDSLRYGLYRQMDQLVMDETPVIPIYYDEVIWLMQPGLRGFNPNALNMVQLKKAYFVKQP
ncbi:peptide/nickel transport system substrate-binding protein [Arachidicoccus rhizosphaerae]|uniref:Peptide/nickel transport system substrate-binding protein n=1 Tax=Arachidicoccus rhizosphaerae TaxID=551991 RepID=A0A1H4CIW6_9BACT|nr:ABC transporter substrate-binding protein [Arachidicoccus rhizosphaerae]SEA60376.1 peptide/nickel transport system substrate-binding protein [Arachidicoccus rhizosphaerae]